MSGADGRLRVVVLFGGRSAEHDVSRVTAVGLIRALDPRRFQVEPVAVARDGTWLDAGHTREVLATRGPDGLGASLPAEGRPVNPVEVLGDPERSVVFCVIHGPQGEDGSVQGLLEVLGMPYVGSGVPGSAVAMDKILARRLLGEAGLEVCPWLGLRAWDCDDDLAGKVGDRLGWPVFVKPANLGSSVGVTKVDGPGQLAAAVDDALSYDEWIVVEAAVVGRELECGVLGDREPQASVVGEVEPSREFYDYEDKYQLGAAGLVVPARIPPEVSDRVRAKAVAAFRAVRAEGMARVDFFFEPGGRLLVNEVNTIPGFTPSSMYPMLFQASGITYPELVEKLIDLGLERWERRRHRLGRPPAGV